MLYSALAWTLWQAAPANLTQKFSASRWALGPAPVRSLRRSRLAARDRRERGPAGSLDRNSALPAARAVALARRRAPEGVVRGRDRAAHSPRARPRSSPEWPIQVPTRSPAP